MRKFKLRVSANGEVCLDLGLKTADLVFEMKEDGRICISKPADEGIPTITSPTGKVWMDRNLGADNVGDNGYLFQWGRLADGHQERDSKVSTKVSETITPDHPNFIKYNNDSNFDWVTPQHDELWKEGINNPCPEGFRLPTAEEWQAEIDAGFLPTMDLPLTGQRNANGSDPSQVGQFGAYWSSDVFQVHAQYLSTDGSVFTIANYMRGSGFAIRAIKDD